MNQQEAGYRIGSPMWQCGVCQMYRTRNDTGGKTPFGCCTLVTGQITAYGVCNHFSSLNNPFGNKIDDNTRAALADVYNMARQSGGGV